MSSLDLPVTLDEVRQRSVQGLLALALRGGAGKLISMASLVILSRLLLPSDFGVFAVILLPAGLLALCADAGISAALIQQERALTSLDEQTAFVLRLLLSVAFGGLFAAAADPIGQAYHLDQEAVCALRMLALGPIVDAFGLVPASRLNRSMRFERLAWAEAGSLLAGQGVAILAALAGWGLWSLVAGALATTMAGTLAVNIFSRWRVSIKLSREGAWSLLRFGLPYRGQGALHLAICRIVPALGGLSLSGAQVGYLAWSQDIARWFRIPADYASRVGFAAFARLQEDVSLLSQLLEQALLLIALITFPAVALGVALAPALIVPIFGPDWEPALGPLIVFLLQTPFDALATILLPVIYALGRAGRGLRISLIWMFTVWALSGSALLLSHNLLAIPLAFAVTTVFMVLLIVLSLPAGVRIRWGRVVLLPAVLAACLGMLGRLALAVLR